MVPMRTSSIFKSRWMALLWAGGIIWFAVSVADGGGEGATNQTADESVVAGALNRM
jgi:hypothetical protein